MQEQNYFHDLHKCMSKIEQDLTKTKKSQLQSTVVMAALEERLSPVLDFISIFQTFPGLEKCRANFKTFTRIRRLCANPLNISSQRSGWDMNSESLESKSDALTTFLCCPLKVHNYNAVYYSFKIFLTHS